MSLAVACPSCNVPAGRACVWFLSGLSPAMHPARVRRGEQEAGCQQVNQTGASDAGHDEDLGCDVCGRTLGPGDGAHVNTAWRAILCDQCATSTPKQD